MDRRQALLTLSGLATLAALPRLALAGSTRQATLGAAWRGPNRNDPYFAGELMADWEAQRLGVRYAVPLPGRAHEILAEPQGGLLVVAYRWGDWLLRCDDQGKPVQRISLADEGNRRCCGHAVYAPDRSVLYTTESDTRTGRGWISARDPLSLKKLGEWETHGKDPHQAEVDHDGTLLVANGGVARRPEDDGKLSLDDMDSSLARLDGRTGRLLGQWRLQDARLSLRHMAWNRPAGEPGALLGLALQAEHASTASRREAPVLAIFDGETLSVPTSLGDGVGYCGNIAPAHRGGFALTSTAHKALLWHPGIPEKMQTIVEMKEAYALAPWHGPGRGGGALVATALGLVRWHPEAQAQILPWPRPMALDNHWVLVGEA
ncbi:MAG TPA: DUF1513 domain-containing protein [Thiobacillaceae bacterium]|nr:DUF1513 domain-containing protein [Thiobacillaceae bacterium]HNU64176.1 DUF1513 domain-containing protein [Thiobacillaceae bacterium]